MYILLILATLLFSTQIVFNRTYQRLHGDGMDATVLFSMLSAAFGFMVMLITNGFRIEFTAFSVIMAFLFAAINISCIYCGLKTLGIANLSVYSIFLVLGGMLLPFLYGVVFANEELTVGKILCIVLIAVAVGLSFEKEKGSKKAYIFYIAIFILNGLIGVVSAIHQSGEGAVDTGSFMATVWLFIFVGSLIFALLRGSLKVKPTFKEAGCVFGYACCNSIAQFFALTALTVLPASVQYPVITGGVMVFSTVVSFFLREKLTARKIVAVILAFISTVLIIM